MSWDLVFHCCHQSQADKLLRYFHTEDVDVFPRDFAQEARTLGPRSAHDGPNLALFKNVTTSPEALLAWLDQSFIKRHLGRMYWLDSSIPAAACKDSVIKAFMAAVPPSPDMVIRIAAYPKSLEHWFGNALPLDYRLDPHKFTHVLTMVHADNWEGEVDAAAAAAATAAGPGAGARRSASSAATALAAPATAAADLGASTPAGSSQPEGGAAASCALSQQLQQGQQAAGSSSGSSGSRGSSSSPMGMTWRWSLVPASWHWLKSEVQPGAFPESAASAINKLDEALRVTGLRSSGLRAALDLGASPGGWTMYLAQYAQLVISVDPGALHPAALQPNVRHVRMKAEDATQTIQDLLGGLPVDLLVCDMNVHPDSSSEVVKSLLPFLRPGGTLILTLKFCGIGRDRSKAEAKIEARLQDWLEAGRCLWLMANTVNEMTYVGLRKHTLPEVPAGGLPTRPPAALAAAAAARQKQQQQQQEAS